MSDDATNMAGNIGPNEWSITPPSAPDWSTGADELREWIIKRITAGTVDTAAKYDRYGSVDFHVMGAAMAAMLGHTEPDSDFDGRLAAIAFYVLGKTARMVGALHRGEPPTEDTWWDTAIYALFGLRITEEGEL
jgi:hypothetical protein